MPLWRRCSVPRVLLSFIIRYSTNIVGHHTRYRTMFYTDHIKIANTNSNIDLRVSTMMRDTFLISNVHKIQPGQDTMHSVTFGVGGLEFFFIGFFSLHFDFGVFSPSIQCYIWSWGLGRILRGLGGIHTVTSDALHTHSRQFFNKTKTKYTQS